MPREHGDTRSRRRGVTVRQLNKAFYGAEAVDPTLTVGDAMRQMFTHQLAISGKPPPLRIGRGATVERPEAEARGRAIFVKALYDLVPGATTCLVNPEALEFERQYEAVYTDALHAAASDPVLAKMPASLATLASVSEPFSAALDAKWAVIERWQGDFALHGDWLADLAWRTMWAAREMHEVGLEYIGPLGLGGFNSWILPDRAEGASAREVVFEHGSPVYPVFVEDLKVTADEAGFDMYDPSTEDLGTATDRLLEALRPRVRTVLAAIAADDTAQMDRVAPVRFRSPVAFEWLVRFQVLGHSRGDIARELAAARRLRDPEWTGGEDHYKSNVGKRIREAAELIGLTLRDA